MCSVIPSRELLNLDGTLGDFPPVANSVRRERVLRTVPSDFTVGYAKLRKNSKPFPFALRSPLSPALLPMSPTQGPASVSGLWLCLVALFGTVPAPCLVLPPRVSEGRLPTDAWPHTWLSSCAKSLAWLDPQPTPPTWSAPSAQSWLLTQTLSPPTSPSQLYADLLPPGRGLGSQSASPHPAV